MARISERVFGHTTWACLIQEGLKSYAMGEGALPLTVCVKVHPQLKNELHQRHINCVNVFLLNLFCKMEYESCEVLEEASQLPSTLVYREIRQRCYGFLFNCFCTENTEFRRTAISIKEWCAYIGNDLRQPDLVQPLPIKSNCIPSIENLWFKCSQEEKLRVFWMILEIPMPFDVLLTLPKKFMVLACLLSYLIGGLQSGPLLQPWEVAVFIGQALWSKSVTSLKSLVAPIVDAAAVNLSTLFMRGVTIMMMVYSTCDSPLDILDILPCHYFDGKLFHHLYSKTKHNPNFYELCANQETTMVEFPRILNAVTSNTVYDIHRLDWRNILHGFQY